MPSLGDFLGGLLSDAARARVRGDIEAVRIAEAYHRDPLLKHLPVPRFRLPDITVDIPVLVTDFQGASTDPKALPFDEPTTTEIRSVVRESLRSAEVRLTRETGTRVPNALIERTRELFRSEGLRLLSPGSVAQDVAASLVQIVRTEGAVELSDEQTQRLSASAREAMTRLLSSKLRPSLSWQVAVTAEELKAHDDRDSVMHVRLTISEDGYEVVSRDGDDGFLLTPE